MYSRNKIGPKTEPWGVPLIRGRFSDKALPTITRWDLFVKNDLIHEKSKPDIPYLSYLCINFGIETTSNAFEKSIYRIFTKFLLSSDDVQSLRHSIKLDVVEWPCKNPCWCIEINEYVFR